MRTERNEYKRSKNIWYWVSTTLTTFTLLSGGLWLLAGSQPMDAYLGFPAYFWLILGFYKILGAVAILVPRFPLLKEWAYAGIVFHLTGAAATRVFVGDSAAHIVAPLVICTVAIASWFLRPTSRRVAAERIEGVESNYNYYEANRA